MSLYVNKWNEQERRGNTPRRRKKKKNMMMNRKQVPRVCTWGRRHSADKLKLGKEGAKRLTRQLMRSGLRVEKAACREQVGTG
jgi:hypothetical protein